jgi:hypothetical protein
MRWNGVSILGLTITVTGLGACAVIQAFDVASGPEGRAMALAIGTFASGALIACLGTYLARKAEHPSRPRAKSGWRFAGAERRTNRHTRNFGQRAEYGALPPSVAKTAPGKPPVMITGPR